jgi:hypothetical protein
MAANEKRLTATIKVFHCASMAAVAMLADQSVSDTSNSLSQYVPRSLTE